MTKKKKVTQSRLHLVDIVGKAIDDGSSDWEKLVVPLDYEKNRFTNKEGRAQEKSPSKEGFAYYTLDPKGNPIPTTDLLEWARFIEDENNRIIKVDDVNGYTISTIFMGINRNFLGKKPHIFETMVLDKKDNDLRCDKYATKHEALEGHEALCLMVKLFAELADSDEDDNIVRIDPSKS